LASTGGLAGDGLENTNPLFNLMSGPGTNTPNRPPAPSKEAQELLKNYSHEQIMEMYQKIMKGEVPQNVNSYQESYVDENGKPIIDPEGGAIIQPEAGFVVKTKDAAGQKVFVNMTKHELVDPFEEKPIP